MEWQMVPFAMHLKIKSETPIASWWKITLDGGRYMIWYIVDKSIIFCYLVAHMAYPLNLRKVIIFRKR